MYVIIMSLRLIHFNTLKFQDKPTQQPGQKSALQIHSFDVMLMFAN